jgi:hypothetical protein
MASIAIKVEALGGELDASPAWRAATPFNPLETNRTGAPASHPALAAR